MVHKVLASTEIAYLLVRPGGGAGEAPPYRRVLVPLDGSRGAEWAVTLAASIAIDVAAEIVLLQIVLAPEMTRHRQLQSVESGPSPNVVASTHRRHATPSPSVVTTPRSRGGD